MWDKHNEKNGVVLFMAKVKRIAQNVANLVP